MAKVKVLKGKKVYRSALVDPATGKDCLTEKVVDITASCPKASKKHRCLLLYTRAKRGRIVQITRPYPKRRYTGTHVHFFIDELEDEAHVVTRGDNFGSHAKSLGLTRRALRELIVTNAPPDEATHGH